jgi:hypothetical protein
VGSLDRERMTEGITSPPGERSNLSASALTLFDTCGGERDEATEDAGPDTERGPPRVGKRSLLELAVFCRWRVTLMSVGGTGIGGGAMSCSGAGV